MASFNLANVFFICFFVYIKSVYSTAEVSKLPVALETTDDYLKYTLDPDTKCLGVQYDGKDVLRLDSEEEKMPALKSVYFSIKANVAIANFEGTRRLLRFENGEWKRALFGSKIIRSINLLYKGSCEYYDCFGANKLYSYTANEKVLFNKVRTHPGGKAAEQVIFETDDVMEMVYEVLYDETDPKRPSATIHHLNGLTRKFVKSPGGKWEECETGHLEAKLSTDKVEFIIQSHLPKGVLFEQKDGYLKYSFEDGFKCLSVEYDGKDVMMFDPAKPLPQSLFFTVKDNRVFVNNKESIQILKLDGGKFESVFSGMKQAVGLDIGNRSANGVYDYKKAGKVHTFTAAKGLAFSSVVKHGGCLSGSASVWSTRYSGEFVTKVVYDVTNSKNKVLTLHGLSGLTKKFVKDGSGLWKEVKAKDAASVLSEDKVEFVMKVTPEAEATVQENDTSQSVIYP